MLFNSFAFLLFFPIVTLLFFVLPHKYRWFHLLLASCIFYSYFIPIYILILFFTILIDYYAGIFIERLSGAKRKQFLILSIVANVGVLAFFKYYNFFIDNVNSLAHHFGSVGNIPLLSIILPIGLSFHTFQAMSYTIEVYRGNQEAEKHLGIYALYVMFYPQLVAGPIERPQNVLPQFHEEKIYDAALLNSGIRLMLWGLFKKVVISDRLSIYVNLIYAHPEQYHYVNLLIAVLLFSIQIYCDFSGYSDIAIGSARTMGYHLMTNFNRPYFSKNIQEFWAKWHISLSTWFRDYVYISLGGNRVGLRRLYLNVAIVFLLSGFWHGANWTFIVWGALHAVFIICYMLYKKHLKRKFADHVWIQFLSMAFTFSLVSFAWIFFRAESVEKANTFIGYIFSRHQPSAFADYLIDKDLSFIFNKFSFFISAVCLFFLIVVEYFVEPGLEKIGKKGFVDMSFSALLIVLIIFFGVFKNTSFIYFQF